MKTLFFSILSKELAAQTLTHIMGLLKPSAVDRLYPDSTAPERATSYFVVVGEDRDLSDVAQQLRSVPNVIDVETPSPRSLIQ